MIVEKQKMTQKEDFKFNYERAEEVVGTLLRAEDEGWPVFDAEKYPDYRFLKAMKEESPVNKALALFFITPLDHNVNSDYLYDKAIELYQQEGPYFLPSRMKNLDEVTRCLLSLNYPFLGGIDRQTIRSTRESHNYNYNHNHNGQPPLFQEVNPGQQIHLLDKSQVHVFPEIPKTKEYRTEPQHYGKFLINNYGVLEENYGGDPFNIFDGVTDVREAIEKAGEFRGFGPSIASLYVTFLLKHGLLPRKQFHNLHDLSIKSDKHDLGILLGTGILKFEGERSREEIVSFLSKSYPKLFKKTGYDPVRADNNLWIVGANICTQRDTSACYTSCPLNELCGVDGKPKAFEHALDYYARGRISGETNSGKSLQLTFPKLERS